MTTVKIIYVPNVLGVEDLEASLLSTKTYAVIITVQLMVAVGYASTITLPSAVFICALLATKITVWLDLMLKVPNRSSVSSIDAPTKSLSATKKAYLVTYQDTVHNTVARSVLA